MQTFSPSHYVMSQGRKTSIQPPGEPHGWQPPHPLQQPLHRHHCQAAGAETERSTLRQRIHFAPLPIHSASCLQHPRENMSDLPSSHSLAIPFRLTAARGILSCLIPASLPHEGMGLLGSSVCSQHELGCTGGVAWLANRRPH